MGGDGVAGAVVFGEGFDLLEVVGQVDGGAVGALFVPGVGGEAAGGGAVFGRDVFGAVPNGRLGALLEELVEAGVEIRSNR